MAMAVVAFGLAGQGARAEVKITEIAVDGQPMGLRLSSNDGNAERRLARISSSARSLQFQITESDKNGRPHERLRYRLEGYDDSWRDLPVRMRASIRFNDINQQLVSSSTFYIDGESPGWRGTVETSDFVTRREEATAPERSASVQISFMSHGGEAGIGVVGIDAVQLTVARPGGAPISRFELGAAPGTDLSHPLGTPDRWVRIGSRADLARVQTVSAPTPHPILVLDDDDPEQYGNWSTKPDRSVMVQPGDRLTLEWQMAHSIGRSGSGQVSYPNLKPGRYWFRVAAARANGELTGQEASVSIEVVAPWYQRWEIWLAVAVVAVAGAVGTRQMVVRRRILRRLAEVEREQALERERARIARDLHDDIGAGLTEIAMQSDWVRRDISPDTAPDTKRRIERICQSAVELTHSVDEIVWAVNPANDTVDRFANYLMQSAKQFLDAAGVRVRFDFPNELPATALPGKVRHFVFQAVREALNNAAKHARADLVRVELKVEAASLRVVIEDNGGGFVAEQAGAVGTHEGLEGMRRRMEEIGGQFALRSRPGGGTRIEFLAPLVS